MDARTLWRGRRDTRSRVWLGWAALSLLLHLPLSPALGWIGLFGLLLKTHDDEGPLAPPITEIPVDLLNDEPGAGEPKPPGPGGTGEPGAEAAPSEPIAAPKPKPKPAPLADAGAPLDGGADLDAGADAGVGRDAGVVDGGLADAGANDAGAEGRPDAGKNPPKISDPVAASGAARTVADANANVRLIVDTEKLRAQPLGPRIGALLAGIYQWRDFFGPTGIDPVRDIDRILVAGPELRRSAEVVAVIQHRLGRDRMHAALDRLVQTTGGQWLDGNVPVAKARADRADRYFVQPSPKIVIVSPESTLASAQRVGSQLHLPALGGDAVMTAYVATPWRAARGLPFNVPRSIRWVRASIEPTAARGAIVHIEAEDESSEVAKADASDLERALDAATQLDLGILGQLLGQRPQRFVERVSFESKDSHIYGEIDVTEQQILTALDFVSAFLIPPPPRAPSRRAPAEPPLNSTLPNSAQQPRR